MSSLKILLLLSWPILAVSQLYGQIEPRLVVGTQGGYGAAGGYLLAYHIGEPSIGTSNHGLGMASVGFLQPEVPVVLSHQVEWQVRGTWDEGGRLLTVNLAAPALPVSYQVWRGTLPHTLNMLTELPGERLNFVWKDLSLSPGVTRWYYQIRALTQNGIEWISPTIELSSLDDQQMGWQVYPNPAKDYVEVTCWSKSELGTLAFELCNSLGQVVHAAYRHSQAHRETFAIDLGTMTSGIYLLRLRWEGGTQQQWIQVNR